MRVLRHNSLDYTGLESAFTRTVTQLEAGNFAAAEVKKLTPGPYYRARLSASDRLIFRFGACRGERCLLLLEVVRNHAYEASRFLRARASTRRSFSRSPIRTRCARRTPSPSPT